MTLAEVLPEVQTLSRLEKIRLIQILAQELEGVEERIEPGRTYWFRRPEQDYEAAAALEEFLQRHKQR